MRLNEDVLRLMTIRVDELEEGPSAVLASRGRDDRRGPRPGGRDGGRDDRPRGPRPPRDGASKADAPKRDDAPKEAAPAAAPAADTAPAKEEA